jgi:hypothetical protein
MMVQVVEKIRTELGLKISLVRLFQFPTLRSLAAAIAGSETDSEHAAVPPEQNRAQLRREMMHRRREIRGNRPLGLLTCSRYCISASKVTIVVKHYPIRRSHRVLTDARPRGDAGRAIRGAGLSGPLMACSPTR